MLSYSKLFNYAWFAPQKKKKTIKNHALFKCSPLNNQNNDPFSFFIYFLNILYSFWKRTLICISSFQIVQDILSPVPLDLPMVLIKPPEACPTAEVYKATEYEINTFSCSVWPDMYNAPFLIQNLIMQRFKLDRSSSVDPLALLQNINQNGISQDVCINDLGIYYQIYFDSIESFQLLVLHLWCLSFIKEKKNLLFSEPPAFEVLPSLKKLKQRVLAASRGEYSAVFMSGR